MFLNGKGTDVAATFLTGDGVEYLRKGIYNFKNHIRLQNVKNMKHFVSASFWFGAKNWSPASGNLLVARLVSPRT